MEVLKKAVGLLMLFAILTSSCARKTRHQQAAELITNPKGACAPNTIANEFLILWKNGKITYVKNKSEDELINEILEPNLEDIESVDPNQKITLDLPPSSFRTQGFFGENNWGVEQIRAPEAWAQNRKGQGIIVAVVDSGLDVDHPQIKNQLAINENEIPNNGIDDDNNGYIDDYKGYNFYLKTGNITDANGHGTHVAGTIAAEHIAGENIPYGVAPKAKLLGLGFMDEEGAGSLAAAVEAIDYAVKRGARVINASWGGPTCDTVLKARIGQLYNEGVLFVAAAGNSGQNLDSYDTYPAKFDLSSQITVGASTPTHYNAHFSNYSETYVHIVAPGVDIYQTYKDGSYRYLDGTSMAAPHVAGAAALVLSKKPSLNPWELRNLLMNSAQDNFYPVKSNGELDVMAALNAAN